MFYFNELPSLLKLIIFLALVLQEIRELVLISDPGVTPGDSPRQCKVPKSPRELCAWSAGQGHPQSPQPSLPGSIGVRWVKAVLPGAPVPQKSLPIPMSHKFSHEFTLDFSGVS